MHWTVDRRRDNSFGLQTWIYSRLGAASGCSLWRDTGSVGAIGDPRSWTTNNKRGDTRSRNSYKKKLVSESCTVNRMQLYSVQVPCTRNFQIQPTNQTAQSWSRALVQVSGKSFLSVCHPYNFQHKDLAPSNALGPKSICYTIIYFIFKYYFHEMYTEVFVQLWAEEHLATNRRRLRCDQRVGDASSFADRRDFHATR